MAGNLCSSLTIRNLLTMNLLKKAIPKTKVDNIIIVRHNLLKVADMPEAAD
jgi:hypothetical protein